jgi:hypothetical protein
MVSWTCCDECLSREDVQPVEWALGVLWLCAKCRDAD